MEISRYNLFINSSQRSSGTNTNFLINLPTPIVLSDYNNYFLVRVEDACIPFSFKIINVSNNTITGYSTGTDTIASFTLTIPEGNYNVNNLINEIKRQLNLLFSNSVLITYNQSTCLTSFTIQSRATVIHLNTCFIMNMLGAPTTMSFSSLAITTLTNHVNVNPVQCLYIRSDTIKQPAQNTEFILDASVSDILCRVPITSFNSYINHNESTISVKILDRIISSLNLYLTTDQSFDSIQLYGLSWSCTISIIEMEKQISSNVINTLDATDTTEPDTNDVERDTLLSQLDEYQRQLENIKNGNKPNDIVDVPTISIEEKLKHIESAIS